MQQMQQPPASPNDPVDHWKDNGAADAGAHADADAEALPLDQLEQGIQEWVTVDNAIAECNERLRELRARRNALTPRLCTTLQHHQMGDQTIHITDGTLRLAEKRTREGLTQRSVLRGLLAHFDNNEAAARACLQRIDSLRTEKVNMTMQRRYTDLPPAEAGTT